MKNVDKFSDAIEVLTKDLDEYLKANGDVFNSKDPLAIQLNNRAKAIGAAYGAFPMDVAAIVGAEVRLRRLSVAQLKQAYTFH